MDIFPEERKECSKRTKEFWENSLTYSPTREDPGRAAMTEPVLLSPSREDFWYSWYCRFELKKAWRDSGLYWACEVAAEWLDLNGSSSSSSSLLFPTCYLLPSRDSCSFHRHVLWSEWQQQQRLSRIQQRLPRWNSQQRWDEKERRRWSAGRSSRRSPCWSHFNCTNEISTDKRITATA